MPFFTRLPLSNTQATQFSGDTLTLSGTTNIVGELQLEGIPVTPSPAVSGYTLTYNGSAIVLAPPSGSGTAAFDSNRVTTRSGIPAVNVGGDTIIEFLEGYFYPSVGPQAAISAASNPRLYGNNAIVTLNYTATKNSLPLDRIQLDGVNITIVNPNASQSGSTGKTLTSLNTNQTFTLSVRDTALVSDNASVIVTFSHKRYFFGDNQNLIDFNDVNSSTIVNFYETGGTSEFSSTRVKAVFPITLASEFFYYVYPFAWGPAIFNVNGLLNNDFSSKTFSFTNSFGYAQAFYMYRSNNILNGTFNINVQ